VRDSWILRLVPMLVVSVLMWSTLRVVVDAQSAAEPSATIHQTFAAAPEVRIALANVSGRIFIRPSSASVVDVTAVKHARDQSALEKIAVAIDREGNPVENVEIHTRYSHFSNSGGSVDYTLEVPRRAQLQVANVIGPIVVAGGLANDVSANNVSGTVSIENVDGDIKARTVNGGIVASVMRFVADRRVSLRTVSGTVVLTVPAGAGAVVKAQSMSGGFQSDFSLPVKSEMVGSRVNGRIGNGEGWIDLESVSGTLELKSSGR